MSLNKTGSAQREVWTSGMYPNAETSFVRHADRAAVADWRGEEGEEEG